MAHVQPKPEAQVKLTHHIDCQDLLFSCFYLKESDVQAIMDIEDIPTNFSFVTPQSEEEDGELYSYFADKETGKPLKVCPMLREYQGIFPSSWKKPGARKLVCALKDRSSHDGKQLPRVPSACSGGWSAREFMDSGLLMRDDEHSPFEDIDLKLIELEEDEQGERMLATLL